MSTAAGPGGGAALAGASVAPPPIFTPPEPAPAAVCLAQHQALNALKPAATANGPPPATRERVVLLPHARTQPTDTRAGNRRAGRVKGMNQDNSPRQHPPQSDTAAREIATNLQWHDAELAMKVARHSYERWLAAGHQDTPSLVTMHAYHTHTALHEAARAISVLIEIFRAEAATLITTPAHGTDIPTQRR